MPTFSVGVFLINKNFKYQKSPIGSSINSNTITTTISFCFFEWTSVLKPITTVDPLCLTFYNNENGYTKSWFYANRLKIVTRKDEKFLAKEGSDVLYHIFKILGTNYNDIFEGFDNFVDTRITSS